MERIIREEEPEKPSAVIRRVDGVQIGDGTGPPALTPASVSEAREGQPEKLRRRLAGDLDNIVLKAMRKEPERRYASVEQFSEDIRRHLEGLPVVARKNALAYRISKFIKRNKAAVLAVALTAAFVTLVATAIPFFTSRGQIESIAVLPFVNVSADPSMEYLSDGITETLMDQLSQLPKLKVISHTSVFRYRGKEQDPQAVGKSLKVQAVLTGKVVQSDGNLSISVELVEVRNNRHLWGDKYSRKLSEVLLLQEEVARQMSDKLRSRLSGEDKKRLTKRYTENIDAYHLYLKGRYFWNKGTGDGLQKAIEQFEQAIELDSRYALAYAWLADALAVSTRFRIIPPEDAYTKAKAAALKGLQLDNTLAEAHIALGVVNLYYDWDWPAAEVNFKRAIALEPGEARTQAYAVGLTWVGRFDEALGEIQRTRELDPVNPGVNGDAALILYYARRYDQAISEARKALELDPNFPLAHRFLGKAYLEKGLYDQAIAAFRRAIASRGIPLLKAELGHAYAVSGQRSDARKVLSELKDPSNRKYVASFDMAVVHAGLGEMDQAFELLQRSYAERERWLVTLKVEPVFDPLRSDPRFADLIHRFGLWQTPPLP